MDKRRHLIWLRLLIAVICVHSFNAQDKSKIDSLETSYLTQNLSIPEQMAILSELANKHPNPSQSLLYSDKLLVLAQSQNSTKNIINALQQKGNALTIKGNLSQALEIFMDGVQLAKEEKEIEMLGGFYISIAGVYSVMDNKSHTILYYKKAIEVLKDLDDKSNYAAAIENLGDEYNLNMAKPDLALVYFEESGKLWEQLGRKAGLAYNIGNKGLAYAQLKRSEEAESNITEAIRMLEELGDYYGISVYLTYMSDIYIEKGDYEAAISYANNSLALAKKYGLKDQIADAYLKLSELNEFKGRLRPSLDYYKNYITYRDSVKSISEAQAIAEIKRDRDLAQAEFTRERDLAVKDQELALSEEKVHNKQNVAIGIGVALFLIALLALGLYRRTMYISKTKKIIEIERNRSDKLLLNILPEQTAIELKNSGTVEAKKHELVSVLFSDFKGFTHFAEDMTPEMLVKSISYYFSEFDNIIEKNGLEKIKTIGDAYMCAGGLSFPDKEHAKKLTLAAQEMIDFVTTAKNDVSRDYANFEIRIGINSGPVVAGVVGSKKFAYDIWGDTVNVASRMESMSEVGRINISEMTYNLIKSDFECEYRGEFEIKNHGKLNLYFVNSVLTQVFD
ncbi:tetratricopeptide repeat protein [Subsaximicrobium wynnwilliamsii]|uniref:Tetratricopeptide repeat protein n=1 Tax=Subsaximicrobium wynnwilliamsii TaxID=291179 RepID=A0A5C6ZFD7_9FLAO|nr:adenylate/guanylate cyclase domain-containing protein [Subsaximicrobium wynnwilliamsii]TXD83216.1 tetratricopeptide repeat protein [Subsaximicrobium wynnwilliamsii]TXD88328.1 tetratricopeptide repeat protein [Subsaximicrobium wynnwilliamsii]TXE03049.1 tetratricopeptide repeat protein [Subsaximicrobium wynnwilliamsii]